ncbi:MAG TPA: HEAT repeat domain-containing protein, partial [Phycisphaerae bacterium]|nr:HEAT repeat domain-containing protein [Phycisphaerae bacterium]
MKPLIRLAAAFAFACFAGPAVAGQPQARLSVEQAFEQLKVYDYGQSRRPLAMLELEIARSSADPQQGRKMAERLAAVLTDAKATLAAKRFTCQWLPLVASDAQVPVLAKMLDTAETADMARRTLQAIPGEASATALRQALGSAKGNTLVGVVNSLGVRRDAGAAAALANLLRSRDKAVAAAAATALGQIGGQEAMAALEKAEQGADPALLERLRDAQLRAAASGDAGPAALRLYKRLGDETMPTRWRLAAMSGAMRVGGQAAWPMVRQALESDDALLRGAAANLLRGEPSGIPTSVLVRELKAGDPKVRPLLIDVLGERADPAAKDAVAAFIDSQDETLRVAAVHAVSRMGGADEVDALLRLASKERGPVQQAARVGLERLAGDGVESRFLAAAGRGDAPVRTEAVAAIAARRTAGATDVLVGVAGDKDDSLRRAALDALAVVGEPAAYPKLVGWLASPVNPSDIPAIEKAAGAVAARIDDESKRAGPVAEVLRKAPAPAKPPLLRLLGACGGTQALDVVCRHLDADEPDVRDAAVRVLVNWPDSSAAMPMLQIAKASADRTHRVLAFRGCLRLMKEVTDATGRKKMMTQIRPLATTAEAKKMLLAALAEMRGPDAMEMAKSFLDDPQVKAEAGLAVRKITDARKPKRGGGAGSAAVPAYDKQRSDALKKELAKRAPEGCRLACYLDCGPDTSDGAKGGPTLRLTSGTVHLWPGADRDADIRFGTIAFDGREVLFEATGLDPKRSYHLGFTWWDYDHDTRAQSVWAAAKAGRFTELLGKTKLPAGRTRSEKPAEKTLPLPRAVSAGGTVRIAFRNEADPNAVVSELWLWESEAQSPPPAG